MRHTSILSHLEGLKDVLDEEEVLQRADGRQGHDDGFPHVHVGFLSTQTDVQVQVRPAGDSTRINEIRF